MLTYADVCSDEVLGKLGAEEAYAVRLAQVYIYMHIERVKETQNESESESESESQREEST